MATPWLTDAGAGRRLRWSLDIVERCSVQWAEAMVGMKEECITVVTKFPIWAVCTDTVTRYKHRD
jgi:hypothetical protein